MTSENERPPITPDVGARPDTDPVARHGNFDLEFQNSPVGNIRSRLSVVITLCATMVLFMALIVWTFKQDRDGVIELIKTLFGTS